MPLSIRLSKGSAAASDSWGTRDTKVSHVTTDTVQTPVMRSDSETVFHPPAVDHYLQDRGWQKMRQSQEFQDCNLSGAAAGFVSHKPVTMLFRRWPFRMFIFLCASYFTCYSVGYAVGWIPVSAPQLHGGAAGFALAAAIATSSAPACSLWAAPVLAMCGYPRRATVTVGLGICIHAALVFVVWVPSALDQHFYTSAAHSLVIIVVDLSVAVTFLFKEDWWRRVSILACAFCFAAVVFFAVTYQYMPALLLLIPSSLWLSMLLMFVIVRKWSLQQAATAVVQDQHLYDEVWKDLREQHFDQLVSLAELVNSHKKGHVLQPFPSLEIIYQRAFALNDWYQAVVRHWAYRCGGQAVPAPVKSLLRTLEKVHRSYHGQSRRVLDILRAAIVVEDFGDVEKVLDRVMGQVVMHQVKNRFDLSYDAKHSAGYRDLNCHFTFGQLVGTSFEGFVFELQIHYVQVFALKSEDGHKRYVRLRNLRGD